MARNEWINGYLEAILDVGSNLKKRFDGKLSITKIDQEKEKDEKLFSPTKYFVEEVVNSFDESDLHRTWIKVCCLSL
jgi:sucrose-phosphate synthase